MGKQYYGRRNKSFCDFKLTIEKLTKHIISNNLNSLDPKILLNYFKTQKKNSNINTYEMKMNELSRKIYSMRKKVANCVIV